MENIYSQKLVIGEVSSNKVFNSSRLYCSTKDPDKDLSFSLVDYRNNYFIVDDPNKIIEFYNEFDNREQLINWMRERPKGSSNIHEIEGESDIVVAITTADFDGKYAIDCRESIFKGLHIIFVESGGREDFYFNYVHNCNVGIRKAMEYNPKWVVVSNDDVYKIDDISILQAQLENIDNKNVMSVFTEPSVYHSYNIGVGKKRVILTNLALFIYSFRHKENLLCHRIKKRIKEDYIHELHWISGPRNSSLRKIFLKNGYPYTMTSCFTILSSTYCEKKDEVFNETYITGVEDWELSIDLSKCKQDIVTYKIGDYISMTIRRPLNRCIRDLVNQIFFNDRIKYLIQSK